MDGWVHGVIQLSPELDTVLWGFVLDICSGLVPRAESQSEV